MKITIEYHSQARVATGMSREPLDLPDRPAPARMRDLLLLLAQRHGEALRKMILDDKGEPHPAMLLFIGDEQVWPDSPRELREGDVVTLMPPIAGG